MSLESLHNNLGITVKSRKNTMIIVFFGVKFTGDNRNLAIIATLFRDHSQKSTTLNF